MKLKSNFLSIFAVFALSMAATSTVWAEDEYKVEIDQYISNGSIESLQQTAPYGTTVSLTAIPDEGYFLNEITVEQSWNDVPVTGGTWFDGNTASFVMPNGDVKVSATFASALTAEGDLSVRTPWDKGVSRNVVIPDGVQSFKIIGYAPESQVGGTLTIQAPEGYVLSLTDKDGNGYEMQSKPEDDEYRGFYFYDGEYSDPIESNAKPLTYPSTSGGTLSVIYAGRERYDEVIVTVEQKQVHAIVFGKGISGNSEYGTVSASVANAYAGDVVTLTAIPDNGYVLKEVRVYAIEGDNLLDENSYHPIEFEGGTWYNNEAKFVMPNAPVVYTAEFESLDDIEGEIDIPKSGNVVANIPVGVLKLNVCDDGGCDGDYSDNSDGTLTLTAPEGSVLHVSGDIRTMEEADFLVIYDGADVNAPELLKKSGFDRIDEIYSSGRTLTFRFKSNDYRNGIGLNLSVAVLKKFGSGAVAIYEEANGYRRARIDGNYEGTESVNISEPIEVEDIEFIREFTPGLPATVVLPFSLPKSAEVNGKFYYLKKVVQNEYKWKATLKWIGEGNLPQANTPYVVVPEDEELWFDWNSDEHAVFKTTSLEKQYDSTGKWYFAGSYAYRDWAENDEVLGLAYGFAATNEPNLSTGEFGRMGSRSYVVPLRAFLSKASADVKLEKQLNRPSLFNDESHVDSISDDGLPEVIDVEFVDDDEKTTAIGRINTVTGAIQIDRWFDLKGRSKSQKPKTKGAFFNKRGIVK